MNKRTDDRQWIYYLETPRGYRQPIKIDTILQERLRAFITTKKIKVLLLEK